MPVEAIVFDLGNVLVSYREHEITAELCRLGKCDAAYVNSVINPLKDDLHSGKIDLNDVHKLLVRDHGFDKDLQAFRTAFCCGLKRDEKSVSYMHRLRSETKLPVGVISNICDGHDAWVRKNLQEIEDFDVVIFSNEVGFFKPQAAIYELAATSLQRSPKNMIFIDDLKENVEGAAKLGWQAIHHQSWDETYPIIQTAIKTR
ncbi:MAG: HAD-IA family hydrolase [Oligoflexales bacterium]